MSDAAEVWSTVRIRMTRVGTDDEALASASARLEGLAALLADHESVGGVEVRDPSLIAEGPEFVAVEHPELSAYTTPPQRETVEAAARELAAMLALEVTVEAEDHAGDNWRDAWKRYYRSLYFAPADGEGPRLMIRPSWIPRERDDPALELILDPGRAFGTGLHESTRLCLQVLVELRRRVRSVLDLGCGSGILGLAAARLWPELEALWFADHDPEAIATSEENAAHNGLTDHPAAPRYRVVDLAAPAPPSLTEAELVLANIRPKILIPAAASIAAATAPGGVAVLSGILDEEAEGVLAAYAGLLELDARRSEGGWTALVMTKAGPR